MEVMVASTVGVVEEDAAISVQTMVSTTDMGCMGTSTVAMAAVDMVSEEVSAMATEAAVAMASSSLITAAIVTPITQVTTAEATGSTESVTRKESLTTTTAGVPAATVASRAMEKARP